VTARPPEAFIGHRSPGRLRLKLPDHKGDSSFFARVAETIAALPMVTAVRVNPLTGSVLVLHGGDADAILAHGDEAGLFALARRPFAPPSAAEAEPFDPSALIAFVIAALGVVQVFRGNILGPAAGLFWIALSVARNALASAAEEGQE
tara:strand:+ start:430 stop:873 length:444 start_codon:yes stop_codon:yes gene_type:complete